MKCEYCTLIHFFFSVLHRCHGSNSLRLPQSPGQPAGLGEAEIINGSGVLSSPQHPSDGRYFLHLGLVFFSFGFELNLEKKEERKALCFLL